MDAVDCEEAASPLGTCIRKVERLQKLESSAMPVKELKRSLEGRQLKAACSSAGSKWWKLVNITTIYVSEKLE